MLRLAVALSASAAAVTASAGSTTAAAGAGGSETRVLAGMTGALGWAAAVGSGSSRTAGSAQDAGSADSPDTGAAGMSSAGRGAATSPDRSGRASRSVRRAPVAPAWVRPSAGKLSSGYGPRWGRVHRGLDFAAPQGTPVRAAAAGTVVEAGRTPGYGTLIRIKHGGGLITAYGHSAVLHVRTGDRVRAGQVVAATGSEGRSTGPHLHFEVRVGAEGTPVDPLPWLRARGVRL